MRFLFAALVEMTKRRASLLKEICNDSIGRTPLCADFPYCYLLKLNLYVNK